MKYTSTRDSEKSVSASEATLKGISDDGGLFVPSSFPHLDGALLGSLLKMDYQERVAKILSLYFDEFDFETLLDVANNAYSHYDDGNNCPIVKIEDGLFMLELWHGPTCSAQDMAMSLLPHLVAGAKQRLGSEEKTLVLAATSGDGAAALEAFKDAKNAEIIAFYPSKGVSPLQRLQMTAQEGKNLHVAGIKGNYDSVQTALRKALNDANIKEKLEESGYKLCTANSLNFACIAPEIAYFISAYCDLVNGGEIELGDKINFVISTGSFSQAIAGYYAYKMGLPVNKFIIATNANNVLVDFFNKGVYDVNRKFFKTSSSSQDMLIASDIERLIFEVSGRDSKLVRELYAKLEGEGRFEIDPELVRDGIFEAGWADDDDVKEAIFTFFDLDDYVMDTHTAVGASVYNDYSCETEDETPTVVLSAVSPFKHATGVLAALDTRENDAIKAMSRLQLLTALDCPECLSELAYKDEIHTTVVDPGWIGDAVLNFVKE
ncbi:MAG: threonine synthase, partial [Clostridia bacterium]|nr:threonine synthase [Clostridia bacterium]